MKIVLLACHAYLKPFRFADMKMYEHSQISGREVERPLANVEFMLFMSIGSSAYCDTKVNQKYCSYDRPCCFILVFI